MQRRDAALHAIDRKPGATLPNPMFRFITRKSVVETQCPANHERAVCNVVGLSGRPLLDLVIDKQRANVELFLTGESTRRVPNRRVRNIFP